VDRWERREEGGKQGKKQQSGRRGKIFRYPLLTDIISSGAQGDHTLGDKPNLEIPKAKEGKVLLQGKRYMRKIRERKGEGK